MHPWLEERLMPDDPVNRETIRDLFDEVLRDTSDLAQKEWELYRAELSESIRQMVLGIVMIVVAAVFAIGAIILLAEAVQEWLATVLNSEALSALIVGVVVALITVGVGLYGRKIFSSFSLVPTHTVRSVQADKKVLAKGR
jgi:Putative Actinobacterial Holin-X, holin superfamily III